jgi:hypothetical protein
MEQFRQRIIASSNLSALSVEDCQAYIEYRIQAAGGPAALLDNACFAMIHQFSSGIPRKINNLMDRVLLYGFLEEIKTFTPHDVQQVIQEISGEVANHTPVNNQVPVPVAQHVEASAIAEQPAANPYHAMLTELSGLLDNSLQHKIRMAQQLDELLTQQQQQVLKQNQHLNQDDTDNKSS